MPKLKWHDTYVETDVPKKPKKITGTHFPEVLGLHPYTTDFEAWCRCVRLYEKPFEGNMYTKAGEIIEPKVQAYLRDHLGYNVLTPEEKYGEDFFRKTWGDFFPEATVFGGMWDALLLDDDGNPETVVEIKTVLADGHSGGFETRWVNGEAPDYQALQASLYGHLLGIEDIMVVGVPLYQGKGDYEHPENVEVGFGNGNLWIDQFNIHERYPDFDKLIQEATGWWSLYVLGGMSPTFDEKKDADILKELRKVVIDKNAEDLEALVEEAEQLKAEIDLAKQAIADKEARYKVIMEFFKTDALKHLEDNSGIDKVDITGRNYIWTISKSIKTSVDTAKLKKDGLYDSYVKREPTFTMRVKGIKEE